MSRRRRVARSEQERREENARRAANKGSKKEKRGGKTVLFASDRGYAPSWEKFTREPRAPFKKIPNPNYDPDRGLYAGPTEMHPNPTRPDRKKS